MNNKLINHKKNRIIIATIVIAILAIAISLYGVTTKIITFANSSMSSCMSVIENKYSRNIGINALIAELKAEVAAEAEYLDVAIIKNDVAKTVAKEEQNAFAGLSDKYIYFIIDNETNTIIKSTDPKLVGQTIVNELRHSRIGLDRKINDKSDAYVRGFTTLNGRDMYCTQLSSESYTIGVAYPNSLLLWTAVKMIFPVTIVYLGLLIVIILFLFRLHEEKEDEDEDSEIAGNGDRVCERRYFNKSILNPATGLLLFSLIVFVLFGTHYLEFNSYSVQNTLSAQNMQLLSDSLDACNKDKQNLEVILHKVLDREAEIISELMNDSPEWCTNKELKKIADNCSLVEIAVYDDNGLLTASSRGFSGYKLTNDETDPRYEARKILSSDKDYVFKAYNDGSGKYLLAQKRTDQPGILCLVYHNDDFDRVLDYCSNEEAIKNTDFGNATVYYVQIGDNQKLYEIKPYSTDAVAKEQTLPEVLRQDNYSGICDINGRHNYVCTKMSSNIAIVSAVECQQVHSGLFTNILQAILLFFPILLIVLYSCLYWPPLIIEEKPASDDEEKKLAAVPYPDKESLFENVLLRKMIKIELFIVLAGYVAMLLRRTMNGETLLQFLLYGKWDKGINIFSINASVICGAAAILAAFLIKIIVIYIGKNTGTKTLTVCNIVGSVLQFVAAIWAIGYALYQFGMDPSALLAGAGVAGIVIGIAARGIFEDLIAGLFLVFEGNLHVGDFVSFNDFRGEIVEIGARVSIIQRHHRKLFVNNAELRQYYRLSDELGSAWVEICIGPNEDLDAVKQLIKASGEWYQSRDPNLKDGPFFCNVADFNSSGITICLCGKCTEERSNSTSRKIRYNTIELFRENGITLGKSLVKLELSEEEKKSLIDEAISEQE